MISEPEPDPATSAHWQTAPSESTRDAPIRLGTRVLPFAWLVWLGVVALSIIVFIAKIEALYRVLTHPSQVAQGLMAQVGISPGFRAAYFISVESLSAFVFFFVAAALARLKFGLLPAWLASVAFAAFGASGATLDVLAQANAHWAIPVAVLGYLYRVTFIVFLLVFPSGRFVPPWSKIVAVLWTALAASTVLPAQLSFSAANWPPVISVGSELLLIGSVILAQGHRYRYVASQVQREQTRWVVYGVAVALVISTALELPRFLFPSLTQPSTVALRYELLFDGLWNLALMLVPVTVGIAILRHRLYDIDIIINRTLVYGSLTALVAGIFAATVTLSQKAFVALTGQTSDIAAVLATLAAVAAFTPIKNHLQAAVDSRYKAPPKSIGRLDAFADHVRLRAAPIEARSITRRLLDETVAALDVQCGTAHLVENDISELVYSVGEWRGETKLEVPLMNGDKQIGMLLLGARRNGRGYTQRESLALQRVAEVVAEAIRQDSA
jgi:hypothetical protein